MKLLFDVHCQGQYLSNRAEIEKEHELICVDHHDHLWPVLKYYNKKDPQFIGKKMRPPISGDPFIYYSGWQ